MTQQKPAREPAINFEKSLKQLESIVKKLEQEEVTLETSIKLFEEGQGLVRTLEQQLRAAENRIRQLTETPSGEIAEGDFKPAAASENAPVEESPPASEKPAAKKDLPS